MGGFYPILSARQVFHITLLVIRRSIDQALFAGNMVAPFEDVYTDHAEEDAQSQQYAEDLQIA